MSAVILPFPLHRRLPYVLRQASKVTSSSPQGGLRYLSNQLDVQRTNLLAKGVEPKVADREVRALAAAIMRAATSTEWGCAG